MSPLPESSDLKRPEKNNAPEWKLTRVGLDALSIRQDFLENLFFIQGSFPGMATKNDYYQALAITVRDRLLQRWTETVQTYLRDKVRTVSYLSAEYLPGPRLAASMLNLGMAEETRAALAPLGLNLDELIEEEDEPGLGNGGLGRLAACFLDSLATLKIPAVGYGIRYEFGIFDQLIKDGWQLETADTWLRYGNPWEIRRPHIAYEVSLGGRTEHHQDDHGRNSVRWAAHEVIRGVAYDTPVMGYGVNNSNLLRLWSAETPESFDFNAFNAGDYVGAVLRSIRAGTVSKVLYPSDDSDTGKRLRLIQQHFFVSCSLQDMIRLYLQAGRPLDRFHERFAI
ncbi:MAG: glycogen phosphorylase, partial [Acidobacteria bacterium]|nr:glycogen phosphorylase [Acidobacteriota bacterium]